MAYRDPLSWSQLWAVRWLTGTFFAVQLLCGLLGGSILSYRDPAQSFWMGGALSMVPAFVIGVLVQRKFDPIKLSENKFTVWVLGAIAVGVSGFAVFAAARWADAG
jgi:hypothetical protein